MIRQSKCRDEGGIVGVSGLLRHYWIGLVSVAVFSLAVLAPPAWAGPPAQVTVPTATPTPDEPSSSDSSSRENDDSRDVSELFEPTATPEPEAFEDFGPVGSGDALFDEQNNTITEQSLDELFNDEDSIGGDPFSTDTVFVDEFEQGGGVLDNEEFAVDPFLEGDDASDGIVGVTILNMHSAPDINSSIIDTLFRNTALQVLGRDSSGEWIQVCCGEDRGSTGWIVARDVSLRSDFEINRAEIPVLAGEATQPPVEPFSPDVSQTDLDLRLEIDNPAVFPGQKIELEYWVSNVGDTDAFDVSLRNELPENVEFLDAQFGSTGELLETVNPLNNDASVFRIDWPELSPGDTLTATISVQIGADTGYGTVIDNLAGVGAANAQVDTAGVSLGTPPARPPDFRMLR